MSDLPILSIITFLPLVAAGLLALLLRGDDPRAQTIARWYALGVSLVVFALSLLLLFLFDPANPGFQLTERHPWLPAFNIWYHKAIDGISLWFVLISTFLTPICVLSAWSGITRRVKEFMIALLLLETMMIGMFTARDLVLFYLFFEAVLIPMYLIIGVWGGPGRIHAAFKFFLYTFLGSLLMLLAIIAMAIATGGTDMAAMMNNPFAPSLQLWLWLAFFISFAVKAPMWPLHTWLPYAHVEAPTAGSVMLAGVLLKMGGYGLIRINVQMLPEASELMAPLVLGLSLVAIIYTSLVALAQTDMKKLIAYSSVAHMGYVTLGVFTLTPQGLEGAIFVMLSHTAVSAALFLCVGVLYDRLHSRDIATYGGVTQPMPHFALFFMLFMLASVGLPGTSGFVGEFLAMQGAFIVSGWWAAGAALGMILGAAYMLWLYRRVMYGKVGSAAVAALRDLRWPEYANFLPLAAIVLWMGVHPGTFRDIFAPAVEELLRNHQAMMSAARALGAGP